MQTSDGEADFRVILCGGWVARAEAGEEAGQGEGMRILGDGEVGGEDATDGHGSEYGAAFLEVEGVGCAEYEGEGGEG